MIKYTLEILSNNNHLFRNKGAFYVEGFAFIADEYGEGKKVKIKGLVLPKEKEVAKETKYLDKPYSHLSLA